MSKTALKKLMNDLTKEQLAEVILDMYDARKEAREYLEYFINPDENGMAEKCRGIILKEFFPAKGRSKGRTSVCKKAVKNFTLLHPDPKLVADVKFFLVETIINYAVKTRSWLKESQEKTLYASFEDALDYMWNHELLPAFQHRINEVLTTSDGLRGTLRTRPREIFDTFCSGLGAREFMRK